jgi:hypothetical protein
MDRRMDRIQESLDQILDLQRNLEDSRRALQGYVSEADDSSLNDVLRRHDVADMALVDLASSLRLLGASTGSDGHGDSTLVRYDYPEIARRLRSGQMSLNESLGSLVNGLLETAVRESWESGSGRRTTGRDDWEGQDEAVYGLLSEALDRESDGVDDRGLSKNGALMMALRYICDLRPRDVKLLANPVFKGWESDEITQKRQRWRADSEFNKALAALKEGLAATELERELRKDIDGQYRRYLAPVLVGHVEFNSEERVLKVREWRPDALMYDPSTEKAVALEVRINNRRGTRYEDAGWASKALEDTRGKVVIIRGDDAEKRHAMLSGGNGMSVDVIVGIKSGVEASSGTNRLKYFVDGVFDDESVVLRPFDTLTEAIASLGGLKVFVEDSLYHLDSRSH